MQASQGEQNQHRASVLKAHVIPTLGALLAFCALFLLLTVAWFPMAGESYLCARFLPDGSPNTYFPDLDDIAGDHWTSADATTYEHGEVETRVRFDRPIGAQYGISISRADGSQAQMLGMNLAEQWATPEDMNILNRALFDDGSGVQAYATSIDANKDGGITSMSLNEGGSDEAAPLAYVVIDYEPGSDRAARMEGTFRTPSGSGTMQVTRTFEYVNGTDLIRAVDTNEEGDVVYRIERVQEPGRTITTTRDSTDTLISTQETTYGMFGEIRTRTTYDGSGNLLSAVTFNYRLWEHYASLGGILFALAFSGLSLTIALVTRRSLKRRLDPGGDGTVR
ncbi:hypothetical protein [[Collinsella] massiliensis]|uniref:Uncharacterized protein n=1 Tax=[Collinsella] massiliensis TaxID=1232426 RepID=A0A1Y3XTK1_9ACTN|nr:hypothetical protein [[Collinsella] massiliensis]OUN88874.1 hypothetical protein B5G02_04725 [[Collinsella] massiliensis]